MDILRRNSFEHLASTKYASLRSGGSHAAPATERGISRHLRTSSLIQFKKDQTCRAASPDLITPMMNHNFQISLQRRKNKTLGGGAQGVLKEVSASNGALTDYNSLGIQQINQICDAKTQVAAHLIEDPFHRFIASFGFSN